jgi:hypothetical protein
VRLVAGSAIGTDDADGRSARHCVGGVLCCAVRVSWLRPSAKFRGCGASNFLGGAILMCDAKTINLA